MRGYKVLLEVLLYEERFKDLGRFIIHLAKREQYKRPLSDYFNCLSNGCSLCKDFSIEQLRRYQSILAYIQKLNQVWRFFLENQDHYYLKEKDFLQFDTEVLMEVFSKGRALDKDETKGIIKHYFSNRQSFWDGNLSLANLSERRVVDIVLNILTGCGVGYLVVGLFVAAYKAAKGKELSVMNVSEALLFSHKKTAREREVLAAMA